MRVLMLAPPGAGKGTQGTRIARHFGIPHISTGDLLRQHMERRTPLGEQVQRIVTSGELVPDSLISRLVGAALADADQAGGYVLDGLPRTLAQAHALEHDDLVPDVVVHLEVPEPELVRRMLERARADGRPDDTEATIRHRLEVYRESTLPVVRYYCDLGILASVNAVGSVDGVWNRVLTAVLDVRRKAAAVAEAVQSSVPRPTSRRSVLADFGRPR